MKLNRQKKYLRYVSKHFNTYKKLPPLSFCLRITFESFLVSFLVAIFLIILGVVVGLIDINTPPEFIAEGEESFSYSDSFFPMVIFAPIVETVLFQLFPVFLVGLFGENNNWKIAIATLAFAIPHFLLGFVAGISAGVIGGFYLAFTYLHWRKDSRWRAFWVTTLSHGIHNLIAFLGILILDLTSSGLAVP